MTKPLNKFAVALWVLAAVFAIFDIGELFFSRIYVEESGGLYLLIGSISAAIAGTIWHSASLAGLGALIETADRILWHLKKSN